LQAWMPFFGALDDLSPVELFLHRLAEHGVDLASRYRLMNMLAKDPPGPAEALLVEADHRVVADDDEAAIRVQGEDFQTMKDGGEHLSALIGRLRRHEKLLSRTKCHRGWPPSNSKSTSR
jgi:hypothetical protein